MRWKRVAMTSQGFCRKYNGKLIKNNSLKSLKKIPIDVLYFDGMMKGGSFIDY